MRLLVVGYDTSKIPKTTIVFHQKSNEMKFIPKLDSYYP